uniref:DUF1725 domain-containing protein n=1 Tax=Sus scrofa TaxID=9823 RepID=A0A8D1C830_PIG
MHLHDHSKLFTIAKTWKQPKCSSTDKWIKMWYIYTTEYYSAIKKNKIMPFAATWMELETLTMSEVSQEKKDKYYMISLIICNLTYGTNEPFHRKENYGLGEQTCGRQRGGGESGMDWDFGVNRCKLLPLEWISNKILLYSTGNYI